MFMQPYLERVRDILGTDAVRIFMRDEEAGTVLIDYSDNKKNGTYNGEALADSIQPNGHKAPLSDGIADYSNILNNLENDFDKTEFVFISVVKVFNAGVWTDGASRYFFNVYSDLQNRSKNEKGSANNDTRSTVELNNIIWRNAFDPYSNIDWFSSIVDCYDSGGGNRQSCLYLDGVFKEAKEKANEDWLNALTRANIGSSHTGGSDFFYGWIGLTIIAKLISSAKIMYLGKYLN